MRRRIVQHGSSSLTITLPIKWAEKYNLKKGDELNVEANGSILTINTDSEIINSRKEVNADNYFFTKNDLSHLYQLGYDEVEITFSDSATVNIVKNRLSECIGYEIIDQSPTRIHIKSIATTIEAEFDTLLRKAFQTTNEMAKEMLDLLKKQDYSDLVHVRDMEGLNNRFTDVCIRILNKKGYKVQKRTMQMYEVVKNIERISDEFKYICDLLKDFKGKLSSKSLQLISEVIDYYLSFYNMMYKFDPKLKEKIYLERKPLLEKIKKNLETTKGKESILQHHLISLIQKSYEGSGGCLTLTL